MIRLCDFNHELTQSQILEEFNVKLGRIHPHLIFQIGLKTMSVYKNPHLSQMPQKSWLTELTHLYK